MANILQYNYAIMDYVCIATEQMENALARIVYLEHTFGLTGLKLQVL